MATIYSSVVLPNVATSPGLATVQLTEDGQVLVLTRTSLHILTPTLGFTLDQSGALKGSGKGSSDDERKTAINWLRTQIELPISNVLWALESDEFPTAVFSSLESLWHSCCASPSGLSIVDGCLLVTLTSNLELALWEPVKHFAEGEWRLMQNITPLLKEHYSDVKNRNQRALRLQTVSIAWSPQPAQIQDQSTHLSRSASLLAVASRAGIVTFLRYDPLSNSLACASDTTLSDDWITSLAWSPWSDAGLVKRSAILACARPSGAIELIIVSQETDQASLAWVLQIERITTDVDELLLEDDCQISALRWITTHNQVSVLVFCKPGRVCLFTFATGVAAARWSGLRTIQLQTQRISVESTAFAPAAGISYIRDRDAVVVALFDGSVHTIHRVSEAPEYIVNGDAEGFDSASVSQAVRAAFVRHHSQLTSGPKTTVHEANRTTGCVNFADSGHMLWLSEVHRPHAYDYVPDAEKRTSLLLAPLWRLTAEKTFTITIDGIQAVVNTNRELHIPPAGRLRSVLMNLRLSLDDSLLRQVVDLLINIARTPETFYDFDPSVQDAETLLRALKPRFDVNPHLHQLRLRYFLLTVCSQCTNNSELKSTIAQALQQVDVDITRIRLAIFLVLIGDKFIEQEHDQFLARLLVQATRLRCSAQVLDIASRIATRLSVTIPGNVCPACDEAIVTYDVGNARCARGHVWAICSVTASILATPHLRTCSVCNRKALLAPSQTHSLNTRDTLLLVAARSWLAGALSEASRRCPYCGGLFVVLV
ncbi:putative zinc-finger of transcription factor IIIC complex-domain-containing protein [Auriculariales sp. MPI-PUGE-AT-0066]|nr:putative zinc-finger of transcription factor IIIC complex-domain-containing protein [Auriculariales sp. MPI-PUGE-AT-0066]